MSQWEVGKKVSLQHSVYADGALIAATVTLSVRRPDGTTDTPTVTTASTGVYESVYSIVAAGVHTYTWSVSGAVPDDAIPGQFTAVTRSPVAYAALASVKEALGITADTTRDDLLAGVLDAASRHIDQRCGRRFYADAGATARVYRSAGRLVRGRDGDVDRLMVDDIASTTGLVVESGFAWSSTYTTIASTSYEIFPENALVRGVAIDSIGLTAGSLWTPAGRVRITAQWGWPEVPDEIAQACLLLSTRLFRRKDSPQGFAGSAEWGVIRVASRDPDVEALIAPYRIPGLG